MIYLYIITPFEYYDSMMCAVNVKGETKTFEGTGSSLVKEL